LPATAASGIEQLRSFIESTQSGRASFEQRVTAKSGRKPQDASGTMAFSRPGKFRWTYDKPYYQLLVGDGEKLWVHDRDLNQVTVKTLGDALASTPAALLAGRNELERNFELTRRRCRGRPDLGRRETQGCGGRFRVGAHRFRRRHVARHGAARQLRSDDRCCASPPSSAIRSSMDAQFRFTPPAGADVIGDDAKK
jgi:outer membrane lipoprotein carrier protein